MSSKKNQLNLTTSLDRDKKFKFKRSSRAEIVSKLKTPTPIQCNKKRAIKIFQCNKKRAIKICHHLNMIREIQNEAEENNIDFNDDDEFKKAIVTFFKEFYRYKVYNLKFPIPKYDRFFRYVNFQSTNPDVHYFCREKKKNCPKYYIIGPKVAGAEVFPSCLHVIEVSDVTWKEIVKFIAESMYLAYGSLHNFMDEFNIEENQDYMQKGPIYEKLFMRLQNILTKDALVALKYLFEPILGYIKLEFESQVESEVHKDYML